MKQIINVTHKQIVMYDILVRAQDNQAVTKLFVSLLLNGFNLLPVLPLDGGGVCGALRDGFGVARRALLG